VRLAPALLTPALTALAGAFLIAGPAATAAGEAGAVPTWLRPAPGAAGRIDQAPWYDSDEPEAMLTGSPRSLRRDFAADPTRPEDIVYQPIGVKVRIVRVFDDGVTLVQGAGGGWTGYTRLNRLVPEIPPGTALRVAGGFGGFADFFPALATPERRAARIATGTPLTALETGVAPYDPDSADLVRVHVRVLAGDLAGRTGWLATSYTGIPAPGISGEGLPPSARVAERACGCRLVRFDGGASLVDATKSVTGLRRYLEE
jgi:hypothetical protein